MPKSPKLTCWFHRIGEHVSKAPYVISSPCDPEIVTWVKSNRLTRYHRDRSQAPQPFMGASMRSKMMRSKMRSKWQRPARILLAGACLVGATVTAQSSTPPTVTPAWKLTWSDEFNGANGSPV